MSNQAKDKCYISLYDDSCATPSDIAIALSRLKTAFPKMQDAFFNLLAERIKANRFTSKRLKDAINHLIDNYHYKELSVADVIAFDRRMKLYTYAEFTALLTEGKASEHDFVIKEINGSFYRILKSDIYGEEV